VVNLGDMQAMRCAFDWLEMVGVRRPIIPGTMAAAVGSLTGYAGYAGNMTVQMNGGSEHSFKLATLGRPRATCWITSNENCGRLDFQGALNTLKTETAGSHRQLGRSASLDLGRQCRRRRQRGDVRLRGTRRRVESLSDGPRIVAPGLIFPIYL